MKQHNMYSHSPQTGFGYAISILRQHGLRFFLTKLRHAVQLRISHLASRTPPRFSRFNFLNSSFTYANSIYNDTSFNERSVEIPLASSQISQFSSTGILEVGNVISHYQKVKHTIVDKFETGSNIISQDIVDFHPPKKFDLIISISTIEHIGFDDDELDPTKIPQTLKHLQSLLSPNGKIFFTVPVGYNPHLDKLLFSSPKQFTNLHFLKRISWNNQWQQAKPNEVIHLTYARKYNNAQAIAVVEISK